jgi:methylmalonyl-CoA mutase C-terminal domain/subunit
MMVARALRDAGIEVIYIGNQMPDHIAETAIQEDADVVGLSTLSGNHGALAPQVVRALREKGAGEKMVVLGGTIPPDEVPELRTAGIKAVFGPGTPLVKIVEFISAVHVS